MDCTYKTNQHGLPLPDMVGLAVRPALLHLHSFEIKSNTPTRLFLSALRRCITT